MKKTGLISMALTVGLLVGIAIPAVAISATDRKQGKRIKALENQNAKQARRINALVNRVTVIENAPDTTTGLADEVNKLKDRANWADENINHLYNKTSALDQNGIYYGVVRRWQVKLNESDDCSNGQPRGATWNSGNLAC